MITEDYVSFEVAKLLKEKGFNERTYGVYDSKGGFSTNNPDICWNEKDIPFISAPTHQMAMKWLRKEKGIAIIPVLSSVLDNEKFLWDIKIVVAETYDTYYQGWIYEKQEAACEAAIKYCLINLI